MWTSVFCLLYSTIDSTDSASVSGLVYLFYARIIDFFFFFWPMQNKIYCNLFAITTAENIFHECFLNQ